MPTKTECAECERLRSINADLLAALKRLCYFHVTDDRPNNDPWREAEAAVAKAEPREATDSVPVV